MELRVLQANVDHCSAAQDLLIQSMSEWLVHVGIVAEPYRVPPGSDQWVADTDGVVAIYSRCAAGSPPFEKVAKGRGCVSALLGDIAVVAVYISPNRPFSYFESILARVTDMVGNHHPHPVIVAGDFNAHSRAWGCRTADVRGAFLERWAIATGVTLLNTGSVPTCVRPQGQSIVDLTFASPAVARRVTGWRVCEEVETMSAHRYVRFDISTRASGPPVPVVTRSDGPRWALKRLDAEVLKEAAIVQTWVSPVLTAGDVHGEAEYFRQTMTSICDAAMPRASNLGPARRVYWWSDRISQLRTECVPARRQYTRHRRTRRPPTDSDEALEWVAREVELADAYRRAKRALQVAIAEAKEVARREMLETLDADPWGRPYRMVRGKLRPFAPPVSRSLQPRFLQEVVRTLFPDRPGTAPPTIEPPAGAPAEEEGAEVTEGEVDRAVLRMRAKNTAPGPDGIPGRALALALEELGPRLRALFNLCIERGEYPVIWKTGKLVLLKKEGRPAESPGAYRPIVLLDEAGKLFERLLSARLTHHLSSVGPDLSPNQFGFRPGRSTIHAIKSVRETAESAVNRGGVVLAVSLDIANAFNTLPWAVIGAALEYHRVPLYLRRLIGSYLSHRWVRYESRDGWLSHEMVCGVPQGSALGPLLWDIGYDWVLRGANLPGVRVTCYADDTLVTAQGESPREARVLATAGVAHVVARIRSLGLEVALQKSEALLFHGSRNRPPPGLHIVVGGVTVPVGSTLKYLGLTLDGRWNFGAHIRALTPKLTKAAWALSGLLPNLGGPSASCRKLYAGIVRSMALYGAPVWADDLTSQDIALLRRVQRVMAVRIVRGYRTISGEAACLLAGTPPWDLEAKTLASLFTWREEARARDFYPAPREVEGHRAELREVLLERWGQRLASAEAGRRTVEAVLPVLKEWLNREHGFLTFRLTQILSGHGCFGSYLCRIGREELSQCHHCDDGHEDTAQHTLEECAGWEEERRVLVATLGPDLSLLTVVRSMVGDETSWRAVSSFCEAVMSQKEDAEREREAAATSAIRARRPRRRRLVRDDQMPP